MNYIAFSKATSYRSYGYKTHKVILFLIFTFSSQYTIVSWKIFLEIFILEIFLTLIRFCKSTLHPKHKDNYEWRPDKIYYLFVYNSMIKSLTSVPCHLPWIAYSWISAQMTIAQILHSVPPIRFTQRRPQLSINRLPTTVHTRSKKTTTASISGRPLATKLSCHNAFCNFWPPCPKCIFSFQSNATPRAAGLNAGTTNGIDAIAQWTDSRRWPVAEVMLARGQSYSATWPKLSWPD